MFSLPTLPTDNLYKFLALGGVAFVIIGSALLSQNNIALNAEVAKETQAVIDRGISDYWKMIDGVRLDHSEKAERTRELTAIEPMVRAKQQIEMDQLEVRLKELRSSSAEIAVMLYWMRNIGMCLTVIGFWLWWQRVQRLQDGILRAQHTQELDKARLAADAAKRAADQEST